MVRDTLLLLVDPFADQVPRVRRPRCIAVAILGWSGSAFAAAVLLIAHRAVVTMCESGGAFCGISGLDAAAVILLVVCAVFGMGTARPLRGTDVRRILCTSLASLAVVAAAVQMWVTLAVRDPHRVAPYLSAGRIDEGRLGERLVAHGLLFVATMLYRKNARTISSVSWRFSENHRNKQRLLTVAASIAVVMAGDAVLLASTHLTRDTRAVVVVAGHIVVLIASGVVAVALLGVLGDSIQIARTLWRVPVAFRDVLRRTPR